MPDAHPPLQTCDALRIEDIPYHAIRLDLVESTSGTASHDPRCILAAVIWISRTLVPDMAHTDVATARDHRR